MYITFIYVLVYMLKKAHKQTYIQNISQKKASGVFT